MLCQRVSLTLSYTSLVNPRKEKHTCFQISETLSSHVVAHTFNETDQAWTQEAWSLALSPVQAQYILSLLLIPHTSPLGKVLLFSFSFWDGTSLCCLTGFELVALCDPPISKVNSRISLHSWSIQLHHSASDKARYSLQSQAFTWSSAAQNSETDKGKGTCNLK